MRDSSPPALAQCHSTVPMVALLAEVATMDADDGTGKVSPVARKKADSPDDRDGGPSPMPTSGGDQSGNSSPPSGSDMSSVVLEDRSTPTEEATKPSPRKVTIPEHNISSYKALEAGWPADRADQSHQQPSASAANETATIRGRSDGPPKVITMKSASASKGSSSSAGGSKKPSLRRGKWTVEEEAYVARVIQDFNYGYLDAPAGTTLRTYLSEKLKCDPMRITKKFTGDACIGKRVFHPAVRSPENAAAIDQAQV